MKRIWVLTLLMGMLFGSTMVASASGTKTISVKQSSLSNHECNSSEWHFVINQIDTEANAPPNIAVQWSNGQRVVVALAKFTGGVAHYVTNANLNGLVTGATATIYDGWHGEFNLSHGPCPAPPTPTRTVTRTNTPVPPTITRTATRANTKPPPRTLPPPETIVLSTPTKTTATTATATNVPPTSTAVRETVVNTVVVEQTVIVTTFVTSVPPPPPVVYVLPTGTPPPQPTGTKGGVGFDLGRFLLWLWEKFSSLLAAPNW